MKEKGKERTKKKMSPAKIVGIVLIVIVILAVAQFSVVWFFMNGAKGKKAAASGNEEKYDVDNVDTLADSPLREKRILFLGSSVTYGDASMGVSFVEYLEKRDGVIVKENAVSGTTLVDDFSIFSWMGKGDGRSYVARLESEDTAASYDAAVIQLSTNDATMKKELGEVSDSVELSDFDTKTVTGAMEYIIAYCKETWDCPVVFYTGTYYDSPEYSAMVDRLLELQEKWDIGVIDMYHDSELNDIEESDYDLYMYDKIHPTKAGYLEWWTPYMEEYLYDFLGE